jgi:predicted dehydrogenase
MAKNKKKCVIVGYGGQARSWHKSIKQHKDWDLIGIVDTDTELLANISTITNGEIDEGQTYTNIEDAVKLGEKPDLVIIATPINTHHGLAQEVMQLGLNVIVEKNMASNIVQGRQMVQMALDHPELCTAMGTQYRYGIPRWTAKRFFQEMVGPDKPMGVLSMVDWQDYSYRGEKRWGWRRFLNEIYIEDMSVHWFDCIRYATEMEFTQCQASTFIARGSEWYGSSSVMAILGLAKPEDFNDRHKWAWVTFVGDWGRKGPSSQKFEMYFSKGQARLTGSFGVETLICSDPKDARKIEEDGYMPQQDVENMGTDYVDQCVILEQMSRGIDSGGQKQPGTNFCEGFKSFAVSMACVESSFAGKAVFVPDYWKNLLK